MSGDADPPERTPADTAVVLDAMLGTLATYLRMAGYDAAYALDRGVEADDALADLADAEGRLLVTRDAELAASADGLLVESREVIDQLRELSKAGFELALSEPARCSKCNGALVEVDADARTPSYAPETGARRVWRCPSCGQCFWKGSHWVDVAETLSGL
ncbi:Mut7-C RNAse domain-containing protein [Halorussus marinus]|uniref:Mut7-C RNAse domain-containing protein n=1 Tax=Halorussus marinus TaxID=2505976 RepID=UPI00245321FD|nr:Mut7-C RNAse domain-containing protein [Halorussus marinus]